MDGNKKGRECIIPDISRTYHFGAKGLNVGSFMQQIYFKKHSLNKERNVKLDANKMYKDSYEKEMLRLIRYNLKVPCVYSQTRSSVPVANELMNPFTEK